MKTGIIELPSLIHADAWDDPIFFNEYDTPDIPACLLPGVFHDFAQALAESVEIPEALCVMAVLGVISSVTSKFCKVSPFEGWEEPVNIYTLIALPPANHKSIVLARCKEPLVEWEQEQEEKFRAKIKQHLSERKTQEKIIEGLRTKASKIEDLNEQQKLIHEITAKESALEDAPVAPQLFVNDVTPESLTTILSEQRGRLAIFSDEGGVLETLGGLYSNGAANVDILLKGIDGGEIRVRRKDKSISLIPYLTMVLAVQPIIIQNLISKQAYTGNGMVERFLYVLPNSKLGYRTHDKPALRKELRSTYSAKIKAFLDEISAEKIFTLTPDAKNAWKQFQREIEIELRPDGKLGNCQGWGGKICGFALRIAGLLHVAEHGTRLDEINSQTMNRAIAISELLIPHTLAAFGLMAMDEATEDAKWIWEWILARGQLTFTKSEILMRTRNKKLGKTERLTKALKVLRNRNLISDAAILPTRKPTSLYHVHPLALAKETSETVH
ncbi:MAG TPA: YfjI family protein [Gammaproteobacteria bacterium]|nr:YfjI family protein [Gammaproteobacteria bacterium]